MFAVSVHRGVARKTSNKQIWNENERTTVSRKKTGQEEEEEEEEECRETKHEIHDT